MKIRTYQPGDEAEQAAVYNEAAALLPKFKPATVEEVARRCQAADFDPGTRFYAEQAGQVVGYATYLDNGRVSYPWCRPGHEAAAEPLFQWVLQEMSGRGLPRACAAYRRDWPLQLTFLQEHGFHQARETINYAMDLSNMPTRPTRPSTVTLLRREDVPALFELALTALRVTGPAELERHLFHNPYFPPSAYFVLRSRADATPAAVGILITNSSYADPRKIDADMPCYRLGAFGAEGMQTKRVQGLFSILTRDDADSPAQAIYLLEYAAARVEQMNLDTLAAQAPSDVPHLVRFYDTHFQRQGSFPVFERALTGT